MWHIFTNLSSAYLPYISSGYRPLSAQCPLGLAPENSQHLSVKTLLVFTLTCLVMVNFRNGQELMLLNLWSIGRALKTAMCVCERSVTMCECSWVMYPSPLPQVDRDSQVTDSWFSKAQGHFPVPQPLQPAAYCKEIMTTVHLSLIFQVTLEVLSANSLTTMACYVTLATDVCSHTTFPQTSGP